MSPTKRKAPSRGNEAPAHKRPRPAVLEYHETPTVKDKDGSIQWPAPRSQINEARELILESAQSGGNIMIVPDKDADGLSAGSILRHTLKLLGVADDRMRIHLLSKGNTVHSALERERMALQTPEYIFVIDQGSQSGPPLIDAPHKGLVIDHHFAATESDFPTGSKHVTACNSPPVATSSLLTYHICEPLHAEVAKWDWLCIVGTHGDLGNTLKWQPPFPDMSAAFKKYTKKTLSSVVSLVNAPRRTPTYDVVSAWEALSYADGPASILKSRRLRDARAEVTAEVERCTHAAPKFSGDGKVAVFRIKSQAQVHPVIATRWAGHLQSSKLEIVLVANEGYLENMVNFSCRIARCARSRDPPVNIIESLKAYASLPSLDNVEGGDLDHDLHAQRPELLERMGENFARGHVQASGGIVAPQDFEALMRRMEVGVKKASSSSRSKKKKEPDAKQKNTLLGYFKKSNEDTT